MHFSNYWKINLQAVIFIPLPNLVSTHYNFYDINLLYNNKPYYIFVYRIYLYLYYVPTYMLWSEEVEYARIDSGLWLWFTAECLDSVRVSHVHLKYLHFR